MLLSLKVASQPRSEFRNTHNKEPTKKPRNKNNKGVLGVEKIWAKKERKKERKKRNRKQRFAVDRLIFL